ncbi:hypothetical protein M4578_22390 [Salipiger sp. P9]|uniref:hypothetical protein n=1 Tax=Salipiger pentaromativorans TaxID=2943193 RepID=UPI0021588008|nr:hypothetical protein [Salipiger pentaromativorans]MCR8550581.1 hypothetical protein [Salipiger pentaromativorans]
MKKAYVAFAALPVLCGAAGYGAGHFLPPAEEHGPQHAAVTDDGGRSEAEKVLDEMATKASEPVVTEEHDPHIANPSSSHGESRPAHETEASLIRASAYSDSSVVRLGRVSVPVYRANSVTYVVSEVGVAMRDTKVAEVFNEAENASRLRDAVLTSMHRAASTSSMQGVNIDTHKLSETLASDLRAGFGEDVSNVLFLSLVKADVPRS